MSHRKDRGHGLDLKQQVQRTFYRMHKKSPYEKPGRAMRRRTEAEAEIRGVPYGSMAAKMPKKKR